MTQFYQQWDLREKKLKKEYNISILNDDLYLRRKYFDGNYEEFINYITNIQQLITLYSSFENTIKSYFNYTREKCR